MAISTKKTIERSVMDLEAIELGRRFYPIKSRAAFAKLHGLNATMIQQHLTAARPISLDYARKYAKAFDVKLVDISKRLHDEIQKSNEYVDVDKSDQYSFVDSVDLKLSAGTGNIVSTHDVTKQLAFRSEFLKSLGVKPEYVKGFPVEGDSMVDAHITDGAIVIINTAKKEPINKKFFAIWLEDKYYIKQLIKSGEYWIARSHNKEKASKYPDKVVDTENSGIIGQAIWCAFRL